MLDISRRFRRTSFVVTFGAGSVGNSCFTFPAGFGVNGLLINRGGLGTTLYISLGADYFLTLRRFGVELALEISDRF